jgi:hypothetical protein
VRVLAGDKSTKGMASFKAYIQQKVSALQKKRKKQGKSKSSIKKEVSKLIKKLTLLHQGFLAECSSSSPVVISPTPPTDNESPPFEKVAARGGFTLYLLKKYRHSFAFDVTEQGRIAGAYMTEEPNSDAALPGRSLLTGLRISSYESARLTPFVWTAGEMKRACDNCQGLVLRSLNDSGALAVGTNQPPNASPKAVVFNYSTGNLSSLPTIGSGSTQATSINEGNIIVGYASEPSASDSSAAVWSNGTQKLLPRDSLMDVLDARLKPVREARIKKEMFDRQDLNECGAAEIENTRLIGRPHRDGVPVIVARQVADSGDIMGHIYDLPLRWDYASDCQPGTYVDPLMNFHAFVMTTQSLLHVIPGPAVQGGLLSEFRPWSVATALNSFGQLVGYGTADSEPKAGEHSGFLALNFHASDTEWSVTNLGNLSYSSVIPTTINDLGEAAGFYLRKLGADGDAGFETRAFTLVNNSFTDLNDLMGIDATSTLKLETVSAMNNCGVLVGRAYDSAKEQNFLFALAKDGCPIP